MNVGGRPHWRAPLFDAMRRLKLFPLLLAACASAPRSEPSPQPGSEAMERAASVQSMAVGRPAPRFRLPDQDGRPVGLEQFRDRWIVLYFYPKDDTPGCLCEAQEFTELIARFDEMGAEVVGISPDPPASHRAFKAKYGLKLTLLSDRDKRVMRQYGAWVRGEIAGEPFQRVVRSTCIIGPKGWIVEHYPEVIPQGHAERVLKRLKELQG